MSPRDRRPRALAHLVILAATLVVAAAAFPRPVRAADPSACEPDALLASGAVSRICMPAARAWNGDLVIWAHGYVDVTQPIAIPEAQLCLGGTFCVNQVANALGYGFITTSYRMNGLVTTGVADVADLVDAFTAAHGAPGRVFLVGASEGGLITTLGVEQRPDLFAGGLAACGPIGDFGIQVTYYGDFRVVFDYFFPGLMPGSVVSIPPEALGEWDALWTGTIEPAVFAPESQSNLAQLLRVTHAPFDRNDPTTMEKTVEDALWYSVFATDDLQAKIGGQPFGNRTRTYRGSDDDAALNAGVARYDADPAALAGIDAMLQTTGVLTAPLVRLHTWQDQQVPFVQELVYGSKLRDSGSMPESPLVPALRYGHCNFKPWEALLSFALLIQRTTGQAPLGAESVLADPADRAAYLAAAASRGLAASPASAPAQAPAAPAGAGGAPRRLGE